MPSAVAAARHSMLGLESDREGAAVARCVFKFLMSEACLISLVEARWAWMALPVIGLVGARIEELLACWWVAQAEGHTEERWIERKIQSRVSKKIWAQFMDRTLTFQYLNSTGNMTVSPILALVRIEILFATTWERT
eukprot:1136973-Pelagomonas_calceolata.AAC.11